MQSRFSFFLFVVMTTLLGLSACQSQSSLPGVEQYIEAGTYRVVSVEELNSLLENKNFTLVNVHIPWEGDIPQTDLQLAYDTIDQNLDQLPKKNAKILVYCYSSGMAKIAVETLLTNGYRNVWMLDGGLSEWEGAGYTVER